TRRAPMEIPTVPLATQGMIPRAALSPASAATFPQMTASPAVAALSPPVAALSALSPRGAASLAAANSSAHDTPTAAAAAAAAAPPRSAALSVSVAPHVSDAPVRPSLLRSGRARPPSLHYDKLLQVRVGRCRARVPARLCGGPRALFSRCLSLSLS